MGQTPQPRRRAATPDASFLQLGLFLVLLAGTPEPGGVLQPLALGLPRAGDQAERGGRGRDPPAAVGAG